MGFELHPYHFHRILLSGRPIGAEIAVNASTRLVVYDRDVYEELHPKPGKAPRRLTVTSILPPSNDNSGTARILGRTERTGPGLYLQPGVKKSGTSVMAYTLHSHWKKVSS